MGKKKKKKIKKLNKAITTMRTFCIYSRCNTCLLAKLCKGFNVVPFHWENVKNNQYEKENK